MKTVSFTVNDDEEKKTFVYEVFDKRSTGMVYAFSQQLGDLYLEINPGANEQDKVNFDEADFLEFLHSSRSDKRLFRLIWNFLFQPVGNAPKMYGLINDYVLTAEQLTVIGEATDFFIDNRFWLIEQVKALGESSTKKQVVTAAKGQRKN